MYCAYFIGPPIPNDATHALGVRRRLLRVIATLLCVAISAAASAAPSPEQSLKQQAYAAYRALAIAASRARNEKVVADNFYEAGNLEQAAKAYLHALAVAPEAFYYDEKTEIATRLARANRKPEAVAILEELLTERRNDEVAKLEITKLLSTLQPQTVTLKEVDALLKQDGRNKYALLTKANALRQQKKFRESLLLYRRILLQGSDFDARLGLIYSLLAMGAKTEAKKEFKLISPEDGDQEEQYVELSNELEASTRPTLDVLQNRYSDTDKNKSVEQGATIKVVVGNLDWVADMREKKATSNDVDSFALAKSYSLGATTHVTDRVIVTGKYGRTELITSEQRKSVATGQLKVDVKTGSGVLSGNASWDALNATIASIGSTTQVAKKSIELTQPLTERFNTNLNYAYKNYSDGNAANDFRATATYVLYNGVPQISLGYGVHRTNYKNPLIDGEQPSYSYSAPQHLFADQVFITAYYETERFYVNVDIEYGREAYKKRDEELNEIKYKDQFHYNVATLGFKATRKLSFELNRERSNSATATFEDIYNETTLGARVFYQF